MSRSIARVWMLISLIIMVAGGLAVSLASAAPSWRVRGSALVGSEGITATFLTIGTSGLAVLLQFKLAGGKIVIIISCAKAAIIGGKITAPKNGSATRLSFKGCKIDSKECHLTNAETTEINTGEVSAETTDLATTEPLFLKITPKEAGGPFTSISLTGCAGEGKFGIVGTMAAAIAARATAEQTLHLWKVETITLLTTLNTAGERWSIEMLPSITLINGGNWSSTL
jgi:hypothetical protein